MLFPRLRRCVTQNPSWLGLVVMTLVLTLFIHGTAIAKDNPPPTNTPRHYTDLQFPPLPEVKLPPYERYELKNGIVVYLMEDHQLPLVKGTALFRTGSRWEPSNQVGLADITGTVWRLGGTQAHPADKLNQLLEQRAAAIETSIGVSSGSASFDVLGKDVATVFPLFAEVVESPAFAADQVELAKTQARGAIARRNDDPDDIASREFGKLIYGAESPYARIAEYSTLENIRQESIRQFYQTYIRPQGTILGIVGDFEPQQMKAWIEQYFGDWQVKTPAPNLKVPSATQQNQDEVFLVDQTQLTQSNILLGQLGGKISSPDYPALTVMNGVLNGFGGRLFNNIRSKQGLAYSVYGVWNAAYDYPGIFVAGGQTRTDATVPFIQSLFKEVERIRTTPISPEELAYAKESILNSFVFRFENPSQTLTRLMTYEYYGYPKDFIFDYQRKVKATTIADVQRVAEKYLQPDKMVTLVVGNGQPIQPTLKALNENIQTIDVTIPNPKKS